MGWKINDKRVERTWQREGLKVLHKQPKRGRLWLADGSCIRLRPEHRNHVKLKAIDVIDVLSDLFTLRQLRSGREVLHRRWGLGRPKS